MFTKLIPLMIMALFPIAQVTGLQPTLYDFIQTGLVGVFSAFVIYSRKIDNDNLQKMREHYETLISQMNKSHDATLARYDSNSQDLLLLIRIIKEERSTLLSLVARSTASMEKTAEFIEKIAQVLNKAWS